MSPHPHPKSTRPILALSVRTEPPPNPTGTLLVEGIAPADAHNSITYFLHRLYPSPRGLQQPDPVPCPACPQRKIESIRPPITQNHQSPNHKNAPIISVESAQGNLAHPKSGSETSFTLKPAPCRPSHLYSEAPARVPWPYPPPFATASLPPPKTEFARWRPPSGR
jgi:hypothetical protein